jgi:hypothetical protein
VGDYPEGMFFWVTLPIVFVIFVGVFAWGARGISGREHEPGTQRLNRPRKQFGSRSRS